MKASTIACLIRKSLITANKKPKEMSGPSFKFSPALFQGWQARFLSIKDCILRYSDFKKGKLKTKGVLNFQLYTADIELLNGKGE
jgi:hypothetical protein